MGIVRKIGKEYFIEFHARGLLYQKKAGHDKKAAQRLLKDTEDKIRKGEESVEFFKISLKEFLSKFLNHARDVYTRKTYGRYASAGADFNSFCQQALSSQCALVEITPRVIEDYRAALMKRAGSAGKPVSPKVINLTLVLLRDLMDYAVKKGYINDNPAVHARLVNVRHRQKPVVLGNEEIQKLLCHCQGTLNAIVRLILEMGLEINTVLALKWTEVDFKNKCIRIRGLPAGNVTISGDREVSMGGETLDVLKGLMKSAQPSEGHVFVDALRGALKSDQIISSFTRAVRDGGLDSTVTWRCLRDTFARRMLGKRVSLAELSRLMGLSDIARVMRYAVLKRGQLPFSSLF